MKCKILTRVIGAKLFSAVLFFGFFLSAVYAEEVTIVYTGNSSASLYPCRVCPASVGGGITRRAAVIKGLRKSEKNVFVIDSGNFTAGGPFDLEGLKPAMDEKRSVFYYQAMDKIGYDLVGLGKNELNFGRDFLENNINKFSFKFISANIAAEGILPFYIKEFPGVKMGVVGLAPQSIYRKLGFKVNDYKSSLVKVLKEIEGNCDFVILVSGADDEVNLKLLKEFSQIKVIFSSGYSSDSSPRKKTKDGVIFRPSSGGKSIGVVRIEAGEKGISGWKFEKKKLHLKLKEDPEVKQLIPSCFGNDSCPSREGLIAKCQDAGEAFSSCAYYDAEIIDAIIITDKNCSFCSTEIPENFLEDNFLGIKFKTFDYRNKRAKKIIKDYGIKVLPAFIIDPSIKQEKSFQKFSLFFEEEQKKKILLKKELSGICLFLDRKEEPRKIDLFLDFYEEGAGSIVKTLVNFSEVNKIDLNIHFIAPPKDGQVGYPEEEIKIALAVKKLYPRKLSGYIHLRVKDIRNESWISAVDSLGINYKKIKSLIAASAMDKMMKKNRELIKELTLRDGNVILIKNNQMFKVFNINQEELKGFFKL